MRSYPRTTCGTLGDAVAVGTARKWGGAVSGAARLRLASSGLGGAPSVFRLLSLVMSAIVCPYFVDQCLNKCICLTVQIRKAGLRYRVAHILSFAVSRTFEHAAVEHGVSGVGDVSTGFVFFHGRADAVKRKNELRFVDPLIHEGMKLAHGRTKIIN